MVLVDCIEGNTTSMIKESYRMNLYTTSMIKQYMQEKPIDKSDGIRKQKRKVQKGTYKKLCSILWLHLIVDATSYFFMSLSIEGGTEEGFKETEVTRGYWCKYNLLLLFYNYDCTWLLLPLSISLCPFQFMRWEDSLCGKVSILVPFSMSGRA